MSKKGISQIKGPSEIRLGETAYYEVSRIYDLDDKKKVDAARWKLYALDFKHQGNWRELTPKAGTPPKIGYRVPVIVTNQSLVGSELMLEAYIYEPEKRIPPGLRIKVLPGIEKKITRVDLFKVDDTPIKDDTVMKYGQTIKVKVYTQNMQNEMMKLSLYEDDAQGGGDSPKNKNNRVAYIKKPLNKKGFLMHEFKLNIDFAKIANAVMDGSHDKLHEYYVVVETAEHKSVSKNIDVQNPDYVKVQTVSSGVDTEKIYEGIVIEEVIVKRKFKKQPGINPPVDTGSQVAKVAKPDDKKEENKCACQQYDLVWGDKVSCDFRKKVVKIAQNLGLPQEGYEGANWLMTIMALESAYTFSPKCGTFGKNPDESSKYKYIGLIQFGKAAAEEVETTRTHLMSLTAEKQLDYVEKHFKKKQFKGLLNSRTALYLAVNYPNSTIHASEKDYVVYDSTKDAYDDNPMFKRESHEFWIDKKGNKNYYKGKEGESRVWEFEEALKEVGDLGKSSKVKTFICGNINKTKDKVNAKDIVTYHIYHDNKIEKHIPKKIKEGFENRYKYVYHDSKGNEHEICTADWHTTKEKGVGQVYKTKPTHSKVISDQNVSEGNTSRRVKYENGDIAEYGSHPKKGIIWLLYKAGKNNVELVKMPDSLNYNKDGVSIAYSFSKTQRRYTGSNSFAGFIGYLAKSGYKLTTTGSCFSEGSSFPSQEHCNGRSVDTLYLGVVEQDQKVIDNAIFFHFTEVLKGVNIYCEKLKRAGNGGTLHNSHLHSGNFDSSIIKIIKEQ